MSRTISTTDLIAGKFVCLTGTFPGEDSVAEMPDTAVKFQQNGCVSKLRGFFIKKLIVLLSLSIVLLPMHKAQANTPALTVAEFVALVGAAVLVYNAVKTTTTTTTTTGVLLKRNTTSFHQHP